MTKSLPFSLISLLIIFSLSFSEAMSKDLRYANFPPASTFPSLQMDAWIKAINERTNGQLNIQTFPGGTLLDVKGMLRGIAQGQADIGCISMLYYPGSFTLFEIFGLPLGFTSASEASYVAWEVFKIHKPKELARYKVLSVFTSAPSQIMSTKPINSLLDLQKISLRSSGSISDSLEAIGGQAVSIPMSETPEALQKGVVDGVCSSWDTLYDMNYALDCQFGFEINMPVYPFAIIMNKKSWENLPEEIRNSIDAYADEHVQYTGELVDKAGQHGLKFAIDEHNFKLVKSTEEEQNKINKEISPLIEAWKEKAIDKGLNPDAILADIQKFRKIYSENR